MYMSREPREYRTPEGVVVRAQPQAICLENAARTSVASTAKPTAPQKAPASPKEMSTMTTRHSVPAAHRAETLQLLRAAKGKSAAQKRAMLLASSDDCRAGETEEDRSMRLRMCGPDRTAPSIQTDGTTRSLGLGYR